jgi:hypothetical protein
MKVSGAEYSLGIRRLHGGRVFSDRHALQVCYVATG